MSGRFRVSCSAVALSVALLGVGTSGAAAGRAQAASGPSNDFFAFANPVSTLPYTDAGVNTALATTETAEPLWDCSGGPNQVHNSVWYKFVAPATTTVSASMVVTNLVGNKVAGIIVAYEGTDLTALGKVGCADDPWHENVPRHLAFPVSAGHTYYIQVGAHGWAASGVFTFTLRAQLPPNDFFAFANPVSTLPYTDAGVNTALATTETAEPLWDCSGGPNQVHNSVWYKFVAPATTTVSASMVVTNLVGNKVAGIIVAYEGTDLTALGKVGCADDPWHENVPRHLAFPVSAGHTYYIQVGAHGWAASGVFTFTLTAPRSVVTLYASKTSVRHGTSVTLSGTVRPSRPGANVTIQRKVNGIWRTFTTVRLSSASAYRYVWTPRAAGTFVFRATIGARANPYVLGGTSATRKIVVR